MPRSVARSAAPERSDITYTGAGRREGGGSTRATASTSARAGPWSTAPAAILRLPASQRGLLSATELSATERVPSTSPAPSHIVALPLYVVLVRFACRSGEAMPKGGKGENTCQRRERIFQDESSGA